MDKRCKLVMLPSNEKAQKGYFTISMVKEHGKIKGISGDAYGKLSYGKVICIGDVEETRQHLYITSDDDIKEGDWCININEDTLYQPNCLGDTSDWKKIIATTDKTLVYESLAKKMSPAQAKRSSWDDYHLPQPSQSFITKFVEEYNKGIKIENILVEYEEFENDISECIGMDGELNGIPFNGYRLKVSKDNTITIRRVKDSWSRDEVVEFAKKYGEQVQRFTGVDNDGLQWYCTLNKDKWIEDNL